MKNIFTIIILALTINAFAQVPTSGLIGFWPFNGNANDESGNGNHGSVNGATLTSDRFNNQGKAYSFDGINDYIDLSSHVTTLNFPQPVSFSFWVKSNVDVEQIAYGNDCLTGGNGDGLFIGDGATGSLTNELIGCGHTINSTYFIAAFTSTNRDLLLENKWHHVVYLFNDTLTKIYIDNQQRVVTCNYGVNNGTFGDIPGSARIQIGARFYNGNYMALFNGSIDDFRIYNRVLNPVEITELYNETLTNVNGVSDINNFLNIYPNPVKDELMIESSNFDYKIQFEIINSIGEIIYENILFEKTKINTSGLTRGIYLIKFITEKGIECKKIIKE